MTFSSLMRNCQPSYSGLDDVQGRVERARDPIDDTSRDTNKRVSYREGRLVHSSENGDVGHVGASAAVVMGTAEGSSLGGRCRKEVVNQKVTMIQGLFEGLEGESDKKYEMEGLD